MSLNNLRPTPKNMGYSQHALPEEIHVIPTQATRTALAETMEK